MPESTITNVTAKVWEQYTRRENGESPSAMAKEDGMPGASTITANHKRVKEAIANGNTLQVDGTAITDAGSTGTAKVDGRTLAMEADAVLGAMLWDGRAKLQGEHKRLQEQMEALQAKVPALQAKVDELVTRASALGIDFADIDAKVEAAKVEGDVENAGTDA